MTLSQPFSDAMRQARVLVVDDNAANLALIRFLLNSAGFQRVEYLTDPYKAVELFLKDPYDLVLLDLRMPGIDGIEVMRRMQEGMNGDYLPVLVLTAQTDPESKHAALQGGAKDLLLKPFDQLECLNRIRNLLEVRLLHKEIRDQNKILDQRVKERTLELEETQLEIIRRLGRAAEFRDNETGNHVIRISRLCGVLGQEAGLSPAEQDMLVKVSPMHDIGKIGIPDAILLKPGPLSPEEWTVMKTHPRIGADMLGGHTSPLLQAAREISLTHHEHWDGSGYPQGLNGDQIPQFARIIAVCDLFDALMSVRPYKKSWSFEEAVDYVKKQFGVKLDPALAEPFLKVIPQFQAITKELADPVVPHGN
ncbi:MAG: response regulator [Deltaproteobacteria bacterium]|nr:response regulator [Deltaproteobacteria bacterium]